MSKRQVEREDRMKLGSISAYVLKAGRSHYVTEKPAATRPTSKGASGAKATHASKSAKPSTTKSR
jgi:hypothetical protein